jgi:deoxycytidylate deaminase
MFYKNELVKYLKYALFQATLSKARNQKVGGVLIPKGGEIPIGAYNGPPRGIDEKNNWGRFSPEDRVKLWEIAENEHGRYWHGQHNINLAHPNVEVDPRRLLGYKHGEGLKFQLDVHCETNLVINAARSGVSTVESVVILTCPIPCKNCATVLIQAGVSEVHCLTSNVGEKTEDGGEGNYYMSRWLFENAQNTTLIEYTQSIYNKALEGFIQNSGSFETFKND